MVFAAQDAVVTITGLEFSQVGMAMPIAFVAQGDSYDAVAVMSLMPGRNMFVVDRGNGLEVMFLSPCEPFHSAPSRSRAGKTAPCAWMKTAA